MPEGPEAKRVANRLQNSFQYKTITKIRYNNKAKLLTDYKQLCEIKIRNIFSYGKKVIFQCSDDVFIVSSFGMTGKWCLQPQSHSNIVFIFSDHTRLYFDDVRRFGNVSIYNQQGYLNNVVSKLGRCVLNDFPDVTEWFAIFKKSRKNVCSFLMDQDKLCGIGNYLKTEVLFFAGIHPDRKVSELYPFELFKLRRACALIPLVSYTAGGHTINDYAQPDGSYGAYVPLIYNQSCYHQHTIQTKKHSQRTTYFVSALQWTPQTHPDYQQDYQRMYNC